MGRLRHRRPLCHAVERPLLSLSQYPHARRGRDRCPRVGVGGLGRLEVRRLRGRDRVTYNAFAPEVVYWDGSFYMYQSSDGQGHYVLKSEIRLVLLRRRRATSA